MDNVKTFYLTFGSDPQYPFGMNDFVKVYAKSLPEMQQAFKKRYPNRPGSTSLNYAFHYPEEQWHGIYNDFYQGKQPSDIIYA